VTDSAGFNGRLNVLWKRAAFESGSYTFAHSSASSQGLLIAVSGAVTSGSPIDASTPNTGAGTTTTALSVTTTSANDLLFYIAHDWEGTGGLSPPTGFTERFDSLIYAADALQASAGASGNKTQANANTTGAPWAAWLIALKETASSTNATVSKTLDTLTASGARQLP
jgi:hypothetical protein